MKKNAIALLLSVALAAGSIGAVPVWAAEPMAEATAEITEEDAEPIEEAAAEAVTGMTAEIAAEEEPAEEAVVEEPASDENETELQDLIIEEAEQITRKAIAAYSELLK